MLSSAVFSSSSSALLRGAPPRTRRLLLAAPARAHSGAASRARGGLPRFHAPSLPSSKVSVFLSPARAVGRVVRRVPCASVLVPIERVVVFVSSILLDCVFYTEISPTWMWICVA